MSSALGACPTAGTAAQPVSSLSVRTDPVNQKQLCMHCGETSCCGGTSRPINQIVNVPRYYRCYTAAHLSPKAAQTSAARRPPCGPSDSKDLSANSGNKTLAASDLGLYSVLTGSSPAHEPGGLAMIRAQRLKDPSAAHLRPTVLQTHKQSLSKKAQLAHNPLISQAIPAKMHP